MTWRPEEGQPVPGRGLAILATVFALALALVGAGILFLELLARSGSALPDWMPGQVPAWLTANGLPLVATGASVVGLLALLAVNAARRSAAVVPPALGDEAAREDVTAVERLRRHVEPLATGDLAVWLPEAEGALGDIHRTLNLLIGGVSDLVGVADEASVQLLGAVQNGRGGIAALKAEAEGCRQLADEVVERARHALSAARALGTRAGSRDAPRGVAAAAAGQGGLDEPATHGAPADRLEGIAEVIRDLAEQAHVVAVGISVQAAAPDAPAVLRAVGEDVAVLAEQAGRAVGRIGPLARAAVDEASAPAPNLRPTATSDRAAGGSAASRRVADQVAALAELATSLRASADRIARAQDEAAASFGNLAQRLRRATGRFRLPG